MVASSPFGTHPTFSCSSLPCRSQVRSILMAEAGETEPPSSSDPQSPSAGPKFSHDGFGDADVDRHASKRSRGSDLSSDDQEGFADACGKVAQFFTGGAFPSTGTFPSIPKSSLDGLADSVVSAAIAHLVTTKSIEFPFHRQFTSDSEVQAMVQRCVPVAAVVSRAHLFLQAVTVTYTLVPTVARTLHRLRSCRPRALLRDEPFECREMEGSPLRLHTRFKPDSSTPTRFMIFKPEDPNDFHLMDRLTDVFVEPSRLLSFRWMLPQLVHDTSLRVLLKIIFIEW